MTTTINHNHAAQLRRLAEQIGVADAAIGALDPHELFTWLRSRLVIDEGDHLCSCGQRPWFNHVGDALFRFACPLAQFDAAGLDIDVSPTGHRITNDPGLLVYEPLLRGYRLVW